MNALRTRAKKLIERWTGRRILHLLPLGLDVFYDLQRKQVLDPADVRVVFDVGANVGESTREFLQAFPSAVIHCFEPVASTFESLVRRMGDEPRVRCHHTALSREQGTAPMVLERASDVYRIEAQPARGQRVEHVRLDTVDDFCDRNGIDGIDYLKVDTEGHDLDVLQGASRRLADARIGLVQVEAGMTPLNTRHVPFEQFTSLLEAHRYYLFALYEQVSEGPRLPPVLRRTNPVFLGPRYHRRGRA